MLKSGANHIIFIYKNEIWCYGSNKHNQLTRPISRENPASNNRVTLGLNATISKTECGKNTTFMICSDGSLWCFGNNNRGQLGILHNNKIFDPQIIFFPQRTFVTKIFTGSGAGHVYAMDDKNNIFTWGCNTYGQLGLGHNFMVTVPTLLTNVNNITSFACGSAHTLALTQDKNIYAWGYNGYRQLGCVVHISINKHLVSLIPKKISLDKIIVNQISAGMNHSAFVTLDGMIYAWGSNKYAQLAMDPIKCKCRSTPKKINVDGKHIVKVSCGKTFTIVTTRQKEIYGWGDNTIFQLGTSNKQIIHIKPVKIIFESKTNTKIYPLAANAHHNHILYVATDNYSVKGYISGNNKYLSTDNDIMPSPLAIAR